MKLSRVAIGVIAVGLTLAAGLGASAQAGATLSGDVTYYNGYSENPGVGITFMSPMSTSGSSSASNSFA